MIASLVASPATYFLIAVVSLSAFIGRIGDRAVRMGPMALTAVAMYVISTGIITSYRHVAEDLQIAWWTGSLVLVGFLYLAILSQRRAPPVTFILVASCVFIAFFGAMLTVGMDRKVWWFIQYGLICFTAFLCFLSVDRRDLVGQLLWGILFIAEGIGAAQVFDCQFLHGWVPETGSACAYAYGWSGASYLPMALPTFLMGWVVYRWMR